MTQTTLRNVLVIAALLGLSLAYFGVVAPLIKPPFAALINVFLVPMLVGAVGYVALVGTTIRKLLMLFVVPVADRLFFGSDPAYAWLSNLVTISSAVAMCGGFAITHYAYRLGRRAPNAR